MPLSRREVMKGAALLGSAASIGRAALSVPAAAADTIPIPTPSPTGPSAPGITSVDYFDLDFVTASSFQLDGNMKDLNPPQAHYQVQGLAIDSASDTFFVAQSPDPEKLSMSMELDGNVWTADAYDQHASGDLVIARFGLTGSFISSMYLMGAGHGGQIAAQPGSPQPSLWTEIYPGNPASSGFPPHGTSSDIYGNRIARLPYVGGKLVTSTEAVPNLYARNAYTVERWLPVGASHEYGAAIDTSIAANGVADGLLVLRYRLHSDPAGAPRRFSAYDLAAASNGDFSTPLATTTEPTEAVGPNAHTEGYATCGQYIYLVATDASGAGYLYEIDFNGTPGSYKSKVALPGSGEPESVALYAPGGTPTRMYYLTSSTTHPRVFNLYYIDAS